MKTSHCIPLLVALTGACLFPVATFGANGETPTTPRGIAVEGIEHPNPQFSVRVSVDRPDRIYQENSLVTATVRSSRNGYLYLLYCDAEENAYVVFPNKYQTSNQIQAGQKVVVPAEGSKFRLRVTKPFGTEVLKAIVTEQPVKSISDVDLTKAEATSLTAAQLKSLARGLAVEALDTQETTVAPETPEHSWAEHSIEILTVSSRATREASNQPRRFGITIGISDYQSPRIRDLSVCHIDALLMQKLLLEQCGVAEKDCVALINEAATMKNIQEIFCDVLPKATKAGDTIFIYWSGHGGRCADTGGDEQDNYDEYLPVYDSKRFEMDTVLMDDTFGRWIQKLDGRKIVVMLDACYAGGQTQTAKDLTDSLNEEPSVDWIPFDFASGELARVKDLGQEDLAVVASSTSDEVSHERIEGDLSALTYFVAKAILNAPSTLTLSELVNTVTPKVTRYVESSFPGTKQSVFFQNDLAEPLKLIVR